RCAILLGFENRRIILSLDVSSYNECFRSGNPIPYLDHRNR
ncbi:hypothetical protein X975_18651, partial [Stegodyphus mimosarum]